MHLPCDFWLEYSDIPTIVIGSVSSRFLLEVVILYIQIQTLVIAVPVPILVLNIILGMLKGGQTSSMHEIYIEEQSRLLSILLSVGSRYALRQTQLGEKQKGL